jgi:hypothetical protein
MIRKFKALGLALIAVFAMSAVVASAAQATAGTLTAEGKTVTVTGEQILGNEHVFTLTDHQTPPGSGVFATTKCKKAHFDGIGSVTDGATSITVTPTYSECTAFGQPATVEHTSCKYVLKTETPAGTGWHVNTAIVCNPGDEIHVQTGTCSVTVPAQEDLTTSEVTNSGGAGTAMDLLLDTNIKGITYTVTKDNIGCPLSGTGTFHNGDYVGKTTVKAHTTVGGGAAGITIH